MQFFVVVTALLASVASAADICGATGSNCNGNRFCCPGIQEGGCCTFGGQANSIEFKLPARSRGRAWSAASCPGNPQNSFSTSTAGTFCQQWSSRRSAKWLTGTGLVKAKREPATHEEDCVQASQVITARGEVLTVAEAEERGITME